MKLNLIHKSILLGLVGLSACTQSNIRESFYQGRACAEIKYQCLKQENKMVMPPTEVYVLSDAEEKRIQQDEMTRMYREISLMLEVYYPGFWDGVTDEKVKLDWMRKVHEKAKKYGGENPLRGVIEQMASICAIVGVDFDTNPKFAFIVNKIKYNASLNPELPLPLRVVRSIHDYLRFEVLHKDYSQMGTHYNTWSLRGVQDHMPPITRPIPDFYKETKMQDHSKNLYQKYQKMLGKK